MIVLVALVLLQIDTILPNYATNRKAARSKHETLGEQYVSVGIEF